MGELDRRRQAADDGTEDEAQAQALARQMIDSFEGTGVEYIIINAAGCGHTLKIYGQILADDPDYKEKAVEFSSKIRDIQEFLAEVGLEAPLSAISEEAHRCFCSSQSRLAKSR